MGKSLNNFITLKQAFSGAHERLTKNYEPLAIRQLILNSHYRSPLDFSDAALGAAQSGLDRITETVIAVRKRMAQSAEGQIDQEVAAQLQQLKEKFETAMDDDLNTAVALSVIFEMVRLANRLLEGTAATTSTLGAVDDLFSKLGGDVLGIVKDQYPEIRAADNEVIGKLANLVIEQRSEARKQKDFAKADAFRAALDEVGIVLEDKPDGTQWRWK